MAREFLHSIFMLRQWGVREIINLSYRLTRFLEMSRLTSGTTPSFVITVSARALFDLEESHKIYEEEGLDAFIAHQHLHENTPLKPGPALPLIKKILALNDRLPESVPVIDVVLLTRNSAESATRIFNSLDHHDVKIIRALFTNGAPTSTYIEAFNTQLFLSSNPDEVTKVLAAGVGAATIQPVRGGQRAEQAQIRIAFDGDAVIFSDESEVAHRDGGLEGFQKHEQQNANTPMTEGPLRPFLQILHLLQSVFPADDCPIRTALVTARGVPAHRRALNTLRSWGVRLDEVMFLGGRNKGPFLKSFGADLFFDDSKKNIEMAVDHEVPSAHVSYGVRNQAGASEESFSGGQKFLSGSVSEAELSTSDTPNSLPRPPRPK